VNASGVTPGKALEFDGLPYLLFTPAPDTGADRPPLIVFLHGRRESGGPDRGVASVEGLRVKALPKIASDGRLPDVRGEAFPFMVAAPQAEEFWKPDFRRVIALVDTLIQDRGVDRARCYLTGISMGGFACWEIAKRAPDRFAALIPLSAAIPNAAMDVRHIPAWVFAGGLDRHYPAPRVLLELQQFRSHGAWTTLTVSPEAGHDDEYWNEIYARRDIYEWLLVQSERASGAAAGIRCAG
jgi:predicted peptidase